MFVRVAIVAALLAIGVNAATNDNTFCERYATMLYGSNSQTTQLNLVDTMLTRAILGGTFNGTVIKGLVNEDNNKPYFTGVKTPFIDYTANADKLATLKDHLTRFFSLVLGCTTYTSENPWQSVNLKSLHAGMGINQATMTAFGTQVLLALQSMGMKAPIACGDKCALIDDATALAGLFGMFGKDGASEICSASDCSKFTDFVHFAVDETGFYAFGTEKAGRDTERTIMRNGYVHFDLTATDNIVEADSTWAKKTNGLTSGPVAASIRTFTVQLGQVGTYYFYSERDSANRRVTVDVISDDSSALSALHGSLLPALLATAAAAAAALFGRRA